jgi:metal-dependent amidase/aminoacylase/carboxypeptidase family protein
MAALTSAFSSLQSTDERKTFIYSTIKDHEAVLKLLSTYLSDHPELCFKEFKAHEYIASFLEKEGFEVKRSHLLETSFQASYTHGSGGRVYGLNAEYDALPGMGHACG